MSYQRFCLLADSVTIPDRNTIWHYQQCLGVEGLTALFQAVGGLLLRQGFMARSGQIIDATLVSAPIQYYINEQKGQLAQGKTPEDWSEAKRRQKALHATHTKKHGKRYHGYKFSISVDGRHKFIRKIVTGTASEHDSTHFDAVLDERNTSRDVYADKGYPQRAAQRNAWGTGLSRTHPAQGQVWQALEHTPAKAQHPHWQDPCPRRAPVRPDASHGRQILSHHWATVGQLIEQEFGIRLQVRTIGKYLARWGFTPQKPIKKAYEQRPEAVQQWLQQEYPAIERRAKTEGAEIHWGDETALVNTDVRGRSYAPAGKTPVTMAVGGTRHKLSMIATVTNQGKARWMIIDESFDAHKLIEFLQALIKDAGKKVFLILDNLRVHHSKPVKAWVTEHKEKIELFYLPSYSPELSPEERLNADLKQAMGKRVLVRTKAKLRDAANEHMAMLQQNPERVMSYFQDPGVRYPD